MQRASPPPTIPPMPITTTMRRMPGRCLTSTMKLTWRVRLEGLWPHPTLALPLPSLIDSSTDWLNDCLEGCVMNQFCQFSCSLSVSLSLFMHSSRPADWLTDWLIGRKCYESFFVYFVSQSIPADWLIDWLLVTFVNLVLFPLHSSRLTDWLTDMSCGETMWFFTSQSVMHVFVIRWLTISWLIQLTSSHLTSLYL